MIGRDNSSFWAGNFSLATDISREMVGIVSEYAQQFGYDNVVAERRDAEDQGLPKNYFDAAVCSLGLMYFPEPERAVEAMIKCTRPGGRAVAGIWGARKNCAWAEIFPIVDSVVQSEVCPLFFSLGNGQSLATIFSNAGFINVESSRISCTLDFDDEECLLTAFIDAGPVALAAKHFDADTRNQVNHRFLSSVSKYKTKNVFKLPAEFVVTIGNKPF